MRKLIYAMGVSLDGFIAGPAGDIGWSAPDDELHQFHNEQTREIGVQLLGRRLYEEMLFWETADQDPSAGETEIAFARIWQALPKVVFSRTLTAVEGNARLGGDFAQEVAELKREPGPNLAVGGAVLAAAAIALGLVDEYRLFITSVVLGAGTPFFPAGMERSDLELAESRTFGSRVVYARYVASSAQH